MAEQTTFIETSQGSHTFYFVCEGCGSEGVIDIPIDRMLRQFSCPEECGASYIAWTNPIKNAPDLKCVVCPVFEEA
ncbi:MAG: hypothetical protein L0287_21680 [Anaerolineae bacterium]|nr:hypothetical protein [Anaerolineae bacterium]